MAGESEPTDSKPKKVSRRGFFKTAGAMAGAAAVAGLTVGPSPLPSVPSITTSIPKVRAVPPPGSYSPKVRRYFVYATDGIINVPSGPFNPRVGGWAHRPIYIFGFAKPLSDPRPLGSDAAPVGDPFADRDWIDPATKAAIMMGKAQLPAPPIWGVEGDILEITLFNMGFLYAKIPDPHTIHLHGVHGPTYFDGIPEISFGVPMWMPGTPATTAMFTYKMYCERPGTYMYHCHVEASEHVQMGMYGPLWVYPKEYGTATAGGAAYGSLDAEFDQEAILLLSEMDTRWHDAVFTPPGVVRAPGTATFNPVDYRPNYWLVNGRAFPDTALPGKYTAGYQAGTAPLTDTLLTYYPPVTIPAGQPGAGTWNIPRQPVQTYVRTGVGDKILVRLINMGYQAQPLHFHGVMPMVIGKDTQAWMPVTDTTMAPMFATFSDQRKSVFTQGIFSGETYDLIAQYPNKGPLGSTIWGANAPYRSIDTDPAPGEAGYPAGATPNPFSPFGPEWGTVLPLVAGAPTIATTPVPNSAPPPALSPGFYRGYPLFYLWHIHDDYKVTNDGVYPGGATTLVRLDRTAPGAKPSIISTLIPP